MITKIRMPNRDNGKPVINPVRYICDSGHTHPSFRHALKCNDRKRQKEAK